MRRAWARTVLVCAMGAATEARADTPAPAATPAPSPEQGSEIKELSRPVGVDKRVFGSIELGRGFRFNNPYRLATELGSTAQSASVTAPYVDLAIGAAFGAFDAVQHGAALHASFAMAGIPQAVLTPTYEALYRAGHPFMGYGRFGPSIVLSPDPTWGLELAGGFAWFVTGRLAVATELVFDVYYGAGTHHTAMAVYPILSGQAGLLFDWEFLP